MPNRVLRDWTQSEIIDQLSEASEVFFTRLIMKVDDFGCFYGNTKLLKSACFPLKEITLAKIDKSLNELADLNIIQMYVVDSKKYVKVNDFRQRTRIMRSKFPQPEDACQTDDSQTSVKCPRETETETETETESEKNVVLLCSLSSKDELSDKYERITYSFYVLFKKNLIEAGSSSTISLDKAKLKDWSQHTKRMIDIDKRTDDEIVHVFEFLKINEFWKKNIQSTRKLRAKFEQLIMNAKKEVKTNSGVNADHLNELKDRLT